MCNFAVEIFGSVRSDGKLKFYKLLENGKAQIDAFYDLICKNECLLKDFRGILACMDYVAETDSKMPKTKVNSIKDKGKDIAIEFKKNTLRVYCIKKAPNVLIVLGGFKKEQGADINKLKRFIKENKNLLERL